VARRQRRQSQSDLVKLQTNLLRRSNKCQSTKNAPLESTLAAVCSFGFDQTLLFIKAKSGMCNARALHDVPDAEQFIRHSIPLDLKFT
jgi:hypothetical protein